MDMVENKGKLAKEINETIRYTMWSVFRLEQVLGDADRDAEAAEVDALIEKLAGDDVVVRGTYDVSGLRADADLMIWWHSATAEALQVAYNDFRRTALGSRMAPVWSQMAVHRPAEFNKSHVPAHLQAGLGGDRALHDVDAVEVPDRVLRQRSTPPLYVPLRGLRQVAHGAAKVGQSGRGDRRVVLVQ